MSFNRVLMLTAILICGLFTNISAQNLQQKIPVTDKPAIDSNVFGGWPGLHCKVSNYAKYSLSYTTSSKSKFSSLEIMNISTKGKIEIPQISVNQDPMFSTDGRQVIFIQGEDTLCVFDLYKDKRQFIPHVKSFILTSSGKKQWLAYRNDLNDNILHLYCLDSRNTDTIPDVKSFEVKDNTTSSWVIYRSASVKGRVALLNPETGQRYSLSDVKSYFFSLDKNIVLISLNSRKLIWLDLINNAEEKVFENMDMSSYAFDKSGHQLAFLVKDNGGSSVWYFNGGSETAVQMVAKDQFPIAGPSSTAVSFSHDGTQLLVSYQSRQSLKKSVAGAAIQVYNYKDTSFPVNVVYTWGCFSVNLSNKKIIMNNAFQDAGKDVGRYLLSFGSNELDSYYNPDHATKIYLTSVATGRQYPLGVSKNSGGIALSPDNKYAIWFDADSLSWVSYETATSIKRNISKQVPYPMNDGYLQEIGRASMYDYGIAGWSPEDSKVYLYDRYDLWEIDPRGIVAPVCITKGLGRKQKVTVGLLDVETGYNKPTPIIQPGDKLVFSAYQGETKMTGFWTLTAGSGKDPVEGPLQPYAFANARVDRTEHNGKTPYGEITRIGTTGKYLVTRQSAEEFPNYFITSDFKYFQQLTDFQPQKQYNWLTAELINWTLPDGHPAQGILYKPENFDPSKKYPLIFDYYQGRSEEFHQFRKPDYTEARINIPHFVSNGYLVFVPDIYYKKGNNSQTVVDVVSSAAHYLAKRSYIDSTKFGLQGHSLGGWETNILVTRTQNLFAAACAADGASDIISEYNAITFNKSANQKYYEFDGQVSPYGVGVTPWTNLDVYAKDSPVLYADKATTPLLIVHGVKDYAVPFSQGMEMYLALKRAGKRVWLLGYLNAEHTYQDADAKDLTLRMKQFFDYYLKGLPAPKWMTEETSDRIKDPNDLELDQPGVQP